MSVEKKVLDYCVEHEHTAILTVLVPIMQAWLPMKVATGVLFTKYVKAVKNQASVYSR